ncbi:MAG: SRPBCC family protein [Owenweeksia sp.]
MKKEKLNFSITIEASREKVWDVLLSDETYPIWAAIFMEGSYAKTDWSEGSKVQFLTPDGDGMASRIQKHIPNDTLIIEHLGVVKNGRDIYDSKEAQEWNGTLEIYRVKQQNGRTLLKIEQDILEEYLDYFNDTWPKALEKVKELAEQ